MKIATSDSWSSCHRLGSLLQRIEAGKSPLTLDRPARSGEYGVLKVSAVSWGEFRPAENKAIPADFDVTGVPTVNAGDLIISRANTTELVGAAVIANEDHPRLLLSDKTLKLIPNKDVIWPKYLLYALRTPRVRRHIEAHATGTSDSMRNISQSNLCAAEIPLPSLSEQMRIAAILDKADAIRRLRRESVRVAEELLRSTFLEMFGDPVTNPKGWEVKPLGELAAVNRGKFSPRPRNDPQFYGGKFPFIQTGDLRNATGYLRNWKQTLNEQGREVSRGFERGTVAIAIAANIGDTAIVDFDFYCPDSVVGIVPYQSLAASEYLEMMLRFFQSKLIAEAPETAQKNINLETLRPLLVPAPPYADQERFGPFYRVAYSLAARIQAAQSENEQLFATIVHRAFRGELTAPESAPRQLSIFSAGSQHS